MSPTPDPKTIAVLKILEVPKFFEHEGRLECGELVQLVPDVGVEVVDIISFEDDDVAVEMRSRPEEEREVGSLGILEDGIGDVEDFI